MLRLVDEVFNHIFSEAFRDEADEEGKIETYVYHDTIDFKIGEDSMAKPLKDLFDPKETERLTERQVRDALAEILRERKDDLDAEDDDLAGRLTDTIQTADGNKARSYIEGIYSMYDEKRAWIEAEPDNKAHRIDDPY